MKLEVNESERLGGRYKGGMLLFMFLAALAPLACDAAESFSVLVPNDPISARVGSNVILPCWLSPPISDESMEVRWYRSSFKIPVFHHREGQSQDSSQDPRFKGRASFGLRGPESGGLKGGDVSLMLKNVTLEDEGKFQCYVSNDLHYETPTVVLNVTVAGTVPLLSVRQAKDSHVNVSCASSGWHPQPQLTWSDSQGRSGLSPGGLLHGPAEQGMFSVFSWILTPASDTAWLSCSVYLTGEEERESRVALLTSRPDDQSGQWKAAFIALLILGLLAMAIAALLFLRKRRTGSKDSVANPEMAPLLKSDSDLSSSLPKIIDIDEAAKEKVDITLDEDTAHGYLLLSKNCKTVRDSDKSQGRDPSKNSFTHHLFVLGKEGFTSGRAYWEVKLWSGIQGKVERELKMSWSVGVARESAKRDCDVLTSSEGYWIFSSDGDNGLGVNTESVIMTRLSEIQRPHTLGVFLDYDKNMISFYNVEEKSHILTFFDKFDGKVYPLFGPGTGDKAPLSIYESNVNTAETSNDKSQSKTLPTDPSQPSNSDNLGHETTAQNAQFKTQ